MRRRALCTTQTSADVISAVQGGERVLGVSTPLNGGSYMAFSRGRIGAQFAPGE